MSKHNPYHPESDEFAEFNAAYHDATEALDAGDGLPPHPDPDSVEAQAQLKARRDFASCFE